MLTKPSDALERGSLAPNSKTNTCTPGLQDESVSVFEQFAADGTNFVLKLGCFRLAYVSEYVELGTVSWYCRQLWRANGAWNALMNGFWPSVFSKQRFLFTDPQYPTRINSPFSVHRVCPGELLVRLSLHPFPIVWGRSVAATINFRTRRCPSLAFPGDRVTWLGVLCTGTRGGPLR